jgi:predicted DNA-binding transcriptional regulator YafY
LNQFDRVFQLHRLLSGRRVGRSFEELREELGCSRSSLRRAIDYLRDVLGAPLAHDAALGGYRYEGGSVYELPGLWFTAQELSALLVLEEVTERQPPGILSEVLRPFRAKLEHLAERSGIGLPEWRTRLRLVRMAARPPGTQFGPVADGLARRKKIRIDYHARGDDRMAPRVVSPQRLVQYRDNWYIDAWCHWREGLRTFSVDRIVAAELLDEAALEIEPAALDATLATSYGIFDGKPTATAVLNFSPRIARWVAAEAWHPDQHDQRNADGGLIRHVPFHRSEELVMDILRHGADVEVIAPASLRDEVAARLRQALAVYAPEPALSQRAARRKGPQAGLSR